jgi:hypothetical protein
MADSFEPMKHLIKVQGGREYLPVFARILWFRDRYPIDGLTHGHIETKVLAVNDAWCAMHARVFLTDQNGVVVAAGEGDAQEFKSNFTDHVEKASTAAIGRALGSLGFGTNDVDFGEGEIVDAPRQMQRAVHFPATPGAPIRVAPMTITGGGGISPKQIGFIMAIAREKGVEAVDEASRVFGVNALDELSGGRDGTASQFIDHLQSIPVDGGGSNQIRPVADQTVDIASEAATGMNAGAVLFWSNKITNVNSLAAVNVIYNEALHRFGWLPEEFIELVNQRRLDLAGEGR